VGSIW